MGQEEESEEVERGPCGEVSFLALATAKISGDAPIWLSTNHRVSCFKGPSPFLLGRRTRTTLLLACR